MIIRFLLVWLFLLSFSGAQAQVKPVFQVLKTAVLASPVRITDLGDSQIEGDVIGSPGVVKDLAGAKSKLHLKQEATQVEAASKEIRQVYAALKAQKPTAQLTQLSGRVIPPGVYRISKDITIAQGLTLEGSGIYIFQVEGDATFSPAAVMSLQKGAKAKNVFWQVAGDVKIAANSTFKGAMVAEGNIEVGRAANVQGKLLSDKGWITLGDGVILEPAAYLNADLEVQHTVSAGPYKVGDLVVYTVKLKNLGPDIDKNVALRFDLPSGVSYVSSTTSDGSVYNPGSGELLLPTFAVGAELTLTVTVRVTRAEFSTSVATVVGDADDLDVKNNASELTICAITEPPVKITGPSAVCINTAGYVFRVDPVPGARKYKWAVPEGWVITAGAETDAITVTTNSMPGTGTITVKAVNGCGDSEPFSIAVPVSDIPPVIPGPITGINLLCAGASGIVYRIAPVDRATTYDWVLPEDWTLLAGAGTTEVTVQVGHTSGAVQVRAANGCGNSAYRTYNVEVVPAAPTIASGIDGPAFLCKSDVSAKYRVPPIAGATFHWTVPAGWSIVQGAGTPEIEVLVGPASGTISVNAANVCGTSNTVSLPISISSEVPVLGPVSGQTSVCATGEPVMFSVDPIADVMEYNWQLPAGWVILSGEKTNSITVKPTAAGGLIRVSARNGCGVSASVSLEVASSNSAPATPGPISGYAAPCAGQLEVVYSVPAVPGAVSYQWSLPNGWSFVGDSNSNRIKVNAGSQAGQISVFAINGCGQSGPVSLDITPVTSVPAVPVGITGEQLPCAGQQQVTYSVTNPVAGLQYYWEVPAGWAILSGDGTASITVSAGSNGGRVAVQAMNNCGRSASAFLAVQVAQGTPPVLGEIAGEPSLCNISTQTYTVSEVTGASSYQWVVPAGWSIVSGQGTNTLVVEVKNSGTLSVVAVNGCGQGTQASTLVVVVQTVAPVLTNIKGSAIPCVGTSTTFQIDPAPGAIRYEWALPSGWSLVSGTGTNQITVVPGNTAGTLQVTVYNACAGATQSMQVTPATGVPAQPISIKGETAVCTSDKTAQYEVTEITGAESYVWSVPAGWEIVSGKGTSKIVVKRSVGTGIVEVQAKNGCGVSMAATLSVTVAPLLGHVTTIHKESSMCAGLAFWVDPVQGATRYTWTAPAGWAIVGQGTPRITLEKIGSQVTGPVQISVEVSNDVCSAPPVAYELLSTDLETEIHVPNAFSPNHDGKNDLFRIRALQNYADNELLVMNRWGSEVYRQKGYQNNWDGGGLTEGTYFYILKVRLCDNREVTYKGYVTLVR